MRIILDKDAIKPNKAHEADAGFDLYSRDTKIINPHSSEKFDTGVHIELPRYTVGMLKSKSGLNVKYGITSEGVIDVGYTGGIVAKLYNHSNEPYTINKGDKITQLIILPLVLINNEDLKIVDELEYTDRGANGFGSTGR